MPEPATTPERIHRTPRERVTPWEALLHQHGWTVDTTHTEQRVRIDATHPSGAAVMVTAGTAGRTASNGRSHFYVLETSLRQAPVWLSVRAPGLKEFAATRVVSGYKRRVESKCRCRTQAGNRKVSYATEARAKQVLVETRIQRALSRREDGKVEQRAYPCPMDDRAWHLSSKPSWRAAPSDSALWGAR